jgi:TPR repeat protein
MAGNIAQSSGDHETALRIYRGCAADGDNFSIIALAQYYEQGIGGVAKNPAKVVELFKRVALSSRQAYRSDGMLYYGLALYYGYGTVRDQAEGLAWLHRAADAGAPEAQAFLALLAAGTIPSQSHYFEP